MRAARRIMAATALAAVAGPAHASQPIAPGAAIMEHGSVGAVVGDDPTALLYNPANLAATAPEVFGEATPAYIRMTYDHPGFAPFAYSAVAPIVSFGGAVPVGDALSLGLVAFPSGVNSKIDLKGLPVDVVSGGNPTSAEVSTTETGYTLGVGGTIKLPTNTRIGLSLVQTYAHDVVDITLDQVGSFEQANVHGTFYTPILGVRQAIGRWTLALSVSPPEAQHYQGTSDQPFLGAATPSSVDMTTYAPLTVRTGMAHRWGKLTLNAEFEYEAYGAGREVAKSGLSPLDTSDTNLQDARAYSLSSDWALTPGETLFAGLGYFSKDQGGGLYSGARGPDDHGEAGMRFGNLDGFDRYVAGAGLRLRSGRAVYGLGTFFDYGTATVPSDEPQQGRYGLTVFGVSGSLAWRL